MTGEETVLKQVEIDNEIYYKISNVDAMRPFFISLVSDADHWMFLSSNGGVTAGRKDADHALFPYYTDDKITEAAETTGSKTIIRTYRNNEPIVWEPFSERSEGGFNIVRNLYKNKFGNKIIFEEVNTDLALCYRYQWNSGNEFGFVKKSELINRSDTSSHIRILDGLGNILPFGVGSDLQNRTSNLADAYKRSELMRKTGLGIYALSAIIVDKAEPSEALKANTAWGMGFEEPAHLLSALQLKRFRDNGSVRTEEDVKGEKGAYFLIADITLGANEKKNWMIVANVNQNHSAIVQLAERIKNDNGLYAKVLADIELGTQNLEKLVAASDGLQYSGDGLIDSRHFSNTLFNIMRGGIFDYNYQIDKKDFSHYLRQANTTILQETSAGLQQLPEVFSAAELQQFAVRSNNIDFFRLAIEYLPLKFSRRHGDPSRPWNQFSINTRSEVDGSKILDYQGNWRDIFQNWEALVHSYPFFIEGMICKFLNASTFDGYNPYRLTKSGFDWETIEADNPWSYIGYWGDHQVIYLLKFLEFLEDHQPGRIKELLQQTLFVYANVPYTIKSYTEILENPKDTISFDHNGDRAIRERMKGLGADGALLTNAKGEICRVSLCEKILAIVLAKLSNFVPGGGIWMNTQRPEWNDANNALVGNGLSMVTLYYLRRFLKFFEPVFNEREETNFMVSEESASFFIALLEGFEKYIGMLGDKIKDTDIKQMLDDLGMAGSNFRNQIYTHHFSGKRVNLSSGQLARFIKVTLKFLEHAIADNERADGLYHSYNLISYDNTAVKVSRLSEMLEGQVAVLSSGFLTAEQSLKLLDALKQSSLYRPDQNSYMLYPNKELPGFLHKNTIPAELAQTSVLLKVLVEDRNLTLVEKDITGQLHFNGNFRNARDAEAALHRLEDRYKPWVEKDKLLVLQIFESVFNHKEFTGRSGTFFAFEGLGSIYWHMASKLLLSVQETCSRAIEEKAGAAIIERLVAHYYDINEGIGVHKSPRQYGAFPTDPYSHTPLGKGAQQPGMTGQVKEDILSRFGELGVYVHEGQLYFHPFLLRKKEFITTGKTVSYFNTEGEKQNLSLSDNALFFTYCQVPVIYVLNGGKGVEVEKADGAVVKSESAFLAKQVSEEIFKRSGNIQMIKVYLDASQVRN